MLVKLVPFSCVLKDLNNLGGYMFCFCQNMAQPIDVLEFLFHTVFQKNPGDVWKKWIT